MLGLANRIGKLGRMVCIFKRSSDGYEKTGNLKKMKPNQKSILLRLSSVNILGNTAAGKGRKIHKTSQGMCALLDIKQHCCNTCTKVRMSLPLSLTNNEYSLVLSLTSVARYRYRWYIYSCRTFNPNPNFTNKTLTSIHTLLFTYTAVSGTESPGGQAKLSTFHSIIEQFYFYARNILQTKAVLTP